MPWAKTALVLAVGVEGQDHRAALLAIVVVDVRPRADRDVQGLAVGRELQVARPVPAAADALVAAGDVLDDRLGLARGLRVAVLVGEADHGVGVADVDVFRLGPDRVEGDPERPVQAGGEDLVDLGLAVAVGVAEDADAVGAALGQEQVAVRGADDDAGLGQPGGELRHLEAFGRLGPGPFGTRGDAGEVLGRRRVVGRGQVVDRDLPAHARRVGRPVAEGVLAGEGAATGLRVVAQGGRCGQDEGQDGESEAMAHRDDSFGFCDPPPAWSVGRPRKAGEVREVLRQFRGSRGSFGVKAGRYEPRSTLNESWANFHLPSCCT